MLFNVTCYPAGRAVPLRLLLRGRRVQPPARAGRTGDRARDLLPLHHRRGERHRHRRHQPGLGDDPDDADPLVVRLSQVGLSGTSGMVSALIIGGVVCTALSVAGGFITDLKIGYWLGIDAEETGDMEIPRRHALGRDGGRRDPGLERDLRVQRGRRHGRAAGQRHGGGDPAADVQPPAPWMLYLVGAVIALILR